MERENQMCKPSVHTEYKAEEHLQNHACFCGTPISYFCYFGIVSSIWYFHRCWTLRGGTLVFFISSRIILRAAGHGLLAGGWRSTSSRFTLQYGFFSSVAFVSEEKQNCELKKKTEPEGKNSSSFPYVNCPSWYFIRVKAALNCWLTCQKSPT